MDNINSGSNGISPRSNKNFTGSPEESERKDITSSSDKDLTTYDNNRETASREAKWQGTMRQERENIEERFAQAESEVRRLMEELRLQLEQERERERELEQGPAGLKEEYETLKKAVLDYVIAYGAVDVQVALLRAHRDTGGEVLDNLRRSLEEQANALHNLRTLARNIQNAERPTRE